MKEDSINPEELMQKLNDNQLSDDELEKINGGDIGYVEVDPSKCPYHLSKSKYVMNFYFRYAIDECERCEHNPQKSAYISVSSYAENCCEFAYTGRIRMDF